MTPDHSWDIAKTLQTYYFGYKIVIISLQESLMFIFVQKINLIPHFFLEILSISTNLRAKTLPDKGFVVKYK